MPDRPTIFALSSGRPPVAIAVIRISGSRAGAALMALGVRIPEPRKAGLARISDPRSGEIIDEALVLWFPAPHSETGEDVAELQAHGGRAVIAAILDALASIDGLRMAEAGEFTRRGFENGKLDLTAVEGLADLVGAETEGQRRQAFRQMKGLLGNRAEAWRQNLIKALALVEARIDFSDEADVPEDLVAPALAMARALRDEIASALADGRRGERLREGLVVAIAGPPNAGKSTLLNRIARREAAIVSPYAGTTRDVIEVHLDLGGLPVTLLDTAGIRETEDSVEMEGVRRARDRATGADLVLWVVDASAEGDFSGDSGALADLTGREVGDVASDASTEFGIVSGAMASAAQLGVRPAVWRVRNKIDLLEQQFNKSESKDQNFDSNESQLLAKDSLKNIYNNRLAGKNDSKILPNAHLKNVDNEELKAKNELGIQKERLVFDISATSGKGFDQLEESLRRHAAAYLVGGDQSLVSRARHREMLAQTLAALERALGADLAGHEDLLAEELRTAAAALGRLTGRVDVEDVLDVIFGDFCIGK
ncbi:MAG: tRNA uridine-5-carboxymethylaminomethyl(34) synthesis GTPase MnmE [Pseudolabrys sp.]|nr:tRNA uridine-5-carboxymethylaminomethyl(34) synthesis GTPase MnmE [Pseudolabrys sp.]